jgi:hypothetical protein
MNARAKKSQRPQTDGIMLWVLWKVKLVVFPEIDSFTKEIPKPKKRLNNGPAMQPVIAILAYPFLATAELAIMSPMN